MDPSEVTSSQDVRDGWDSWTFDERVEALDQLANETLDQYGYEDDVDVGNGHVSGDYTGEYSDGNITLEPEIIDDPDPGYAIHETNHETVHAMNDEDGIDDGSYADDDDLDFDENALPSFEEHERVGDIARELDRDGFPPPASPIGGGGGGSAPSGGGGGGESGYASDDPGKDDVTLEIDWASGVWGDTVDAEGNMSVEISFAAPEGW